MMVLDTDHISILEHEDSRQAVALTEQYGFESNNSLLPFWLP